MARCTIDEIRATLQEDGWTLLSDTYKNLKEPLECNCKEGHLVIAPWGKLRVKRVCPICSKNSYFELSKEIAPKQKGTFRLLAVDQATKKTGYAIFDGASLVSYGVFDAEKFGTEVQRVNVISHWLINLIENWQIDYVAFEGIQLENNFGVEVFATLARLQGVLINAVYEKGLPHLVCHTATWRNYSGVKGRSRSDKKASMRLIVKNRYDVTVSDDESDAIGIGLYAISVASPARELQDW